MAVLPTGIGPVTGGYQIERSLRFSSSRSTYLNRTPASAPSNADIGTWSFWAKRAKLGVEEYIFGSRDGANVTLTGIRFTSGDALEFAMFSGGTALARRITTQVFRDPSAWYHFVIVYNSTLATAGDRVKVYVNGVEITTFSTTTNPSQNQDLIRWAANGIPNYVGNEGTTLGNYGDYYLTEVNYLDGQVPTTTTRTVNGVTENILSQLGEFSSSTGVWTPKAWVGTYGNNGFYLPFKTASQWSGYFDGTGDDLTAPSNAAFTYGTGDFTIEGFFFFTGGVGAGGYSYLFAQGGTSGSTSTIGVYAQSGVYKVWNGSTVITGTAAFAQNQWVHIALTRSGTTLRLFVNGVLDGSATNSNSIASGSTSGISIGRWRDISDTNYITGYVSNFRVVKGTAVYTSAFTPPTSQLTAITNTSLLTCQSSTFVDNSTNAFTITANGDTRPQQFSPFTLDVTDDHSGTGNNWIPNNLDLRTTGAGADIMVDSPTFYGSDTGVGGEVRGNYATWNPLIPGWSASLSTYSEGSLSLYGNNTQRAIGTQQVPTTGKWYFEIRNINYGTSGSAAVGVTTSASDPTVTSAVLYQTDGTRYLNGSATSYGATWGSPSSNTDVIGIAVNNDAGTITFYKNNASQGAITHGLGNVLYPVVGKFGVNAGYITANFGQRAFAYTAPSGFKALCTQNLPTPTIGATSTTQANDYFDVVTRTGNNSSFTVSGLGFTPDFFWTKCRNTALSHYLADSVRGNDQVLFSNLTNAEFTEAAYITATSSNGYTLGAGPNVSNYNGTGGTYVDWLWKANGAGSSNTAGTITSTVSANTTSGFSIVTYTGTGANATVGHGLGVAPAMIIVKNRDSGAIGGAVYHTSMGATKYLKLFQTTTGTDPEATDNTAWNGSSPTFNTNVFSVGSLNRTNSSQQMVAYCFAPVAGYSAFGSYTGNGDPNGPFVYTGFRPRFIMRKRTDSATDGAWAMHDAARNPTNVIGAYLFANLADAEGSADLIDFTSNGFKFRSSAGNASSGTFIYAAFAEHPFKYALAR